MPIRPREVSKQQLDQWRARREQVGARIRELRLDRGLTQESLSLEARLSRNMLIGVEWGRQSLAYERLWDIADVLGVTVEDLLKPPAGSAKRQPYRGGRRRLEDGDPA
ncbi:hypothetical protein SAT01_06970 [Sinomonas atrocyanea]|uniref:helix-turn-helix domain-containing protein n=1 Tax=Sinomonas atrocyanea TaxID=37927 RepID=UPI0009FFFB2C|nr:hypothetical protein SAT01_06970 [Sinomonas atrocyanea]GGG69663.1 hypothetical protein GCM10007172_22280 [Sinomonas atrocyanea]